MKTAIIIAFTYQYDNTRSSLPGVKIDLYKIYKYISKLDIDNIIVITDIIDNINITEINKSIHLGIVKVDILDIIDTIKNKTKYMAYTAINTINDMTKFIDDNINRDTNITDKLFIYYSGHSYNNNFLLPNDQIYESKIFLDNIRKNINKGYIFTVMDCCRISSLGIHFIVKHEKNKNGDINTNYIYIDNTTIDNNNIILLASSNENQDSLSYTHGSMFTYCLIKVLNKNYNKGIYNTNINLKIFKQEIDKYMNNLKTNINRLNIDLPNTRLYVSIPNINSIWPWLFGIKQTLKFSYNNDILKIKVND